MSDPEILDARGLSCPQPVMMIKQAMRSANSGRLEILVDCGASSDNVRRAAENAGWQVAVEEMPGREFRLVLTK